MLYDIEIDSTVAELTENKSDIRCLCYELYKLDWLKEHMITADVQKGAVMRWYKEEYQPNIKVQLNPYNGEAAREFDGMPFESWIQENGYENEGIYASFDEFLTNEYLNDYYMNEELLDNDASLIRERKKDLEVTV